MSADLHHLSAAYALNALDDLERQQFEKHYPSCEICSADVRDFQGVAAALAQSTATTPPSSLKSSVISEISQTRQQSPLGGRRATPARRRIFPGPMILAAAAALVLLAGVVAVTLPSNDSLSFDDVAGSPDAVITNLDPIGDDQTGNLQVIWSNDLDGVAVIGSNLADPGADNVYALWFLIDDGVVPAGLFQPENRSISEVLDVADLATNGWGITIEPAGGSAQPTTPVIFAGTI